MTNKEKWAIEVLQKGYPDINRYATSELGKYDCMVADFDEAIDIAIKALEDKPIGEWLEIPVKRDMLYNTGIAYTCSVCERKNCYGKPPYCMYCGARMGVRNDTK